MNFWKAVLANITGYILGSILVSLLTLFIVLGVVSALSSGKEDAEVDPKSVLKLELDGSIRERDSKNPLGELDLPAPFMGDKTFHGYWIDSIGTSASAVDCVMCPHQVHA